MLEHRGRAVTVLQHIDQPVPFPSIPAPCVQIAPFLTREAIHA